jgi:hypothetical protein
MFKSENTKRSRSILNAMLVFMLNSLTLAVILAVSPTTLAATPEERCAGVPTAGGQQQECLNNIAAQERCAGIPTTGGQYQECLDNAAAQGAAASTPTEVPKRVKNDCDGDNIRAGLPRDHPDHCGILDYLTLFIKFLSGLVGVIVVAMITVGGIQYTASADDPNAVNAAKKRIFNAIMALAIYFFIFAILQYLIPGGVL